MSAALIEMTPVLYDYLASVSDREPQILKDLRAATEKATPWFPMQMPPMQGQFMQVLLQMTGARRILEVGTFTGYSSLAMALALPDDARIVTCDVSDEFTTLAREYWKKAGVDHKIELKLGPGVDSFDALLAEGKAGYFDFIFVDADKPNYGAYWDRGLELLRQGGVIIADNTLFQGTVTDDWPDERIVKKWREAGRPEEHIEILVGNTHAARAFNAKVHNDERVTLAMVPVADGMTFGVKR
jgi:predicted O-methyltransferase YrrM